MAAPVKNTLVMIMAGGKGSRLGPLTVHRSKPGVPFAGRYRIIDFVLSNFVNSGYRRIYVLTQYMSSSLIKHLSRNWRLSGFGEYIEVVPAQMRLGEFWYRGTADAGHQNLNLVRDARAEHVCVFGGDHVYKFAVDQMEAFHRDHDADLTVAAFPVPVHEASAFGIIDVDDRGRIVNFIEKPKQPPEMPGRPGFSLVSMGNYIFRRDVLERVLVEDVGTPSSRHDFGRDIIPRLVSQGARVFVYDFAQNQIPGEPEDATPYWRDVGTIDSYFTSNMELRARVPLLDLYNRQWRIRSAQRDYPPARFVRAGEGFGPAEVDDSLICEGSIIASAAVREVVLSYDCFVHAGAEVRDSVILSGLRHRPQRSAAPRAARQELQGRAGLRDRRRRAPRPRAVPVRHRLGDRRHPQGHAGAGQGPVRARQRHRRADRQRAPTCSASSGPARSWSRPRTATATSRPPARGSRSTPVTRSASGQPRYK